MVFIHIQSYSLTWSMRNCPPLTAAWYRESCLHLATDWCRVAYIHTCLQCPACSTALQHCSTSPALQPAVLGGVVHAPVPRQAVVEAAGGKVNGKVVSAGLCSVCPPTLPPRHGRTPARTARRRQARQTHAGGSLLAAAWT